MKARALGLLLLFVAPAALARVISYAPYTNRAAIPAHQLRTTRYFALVEGSPEDLSDGIVYDQAEVVLYDARGLEEPRVVFSTGSEYKTITFAALYQNDLAAGPLEPPPVLLIGTFAVDEHGVPRMPVTLLSSDGGKTWKRLAALDGQGSVPMPTGDFGGPWARGMLATVRIGNPAFPFVVAYQRAAFAIGADGTVKTLTELPVSVLPHAILGQDASGQRFLIRETPTSLMMYDLATGQRSLAGTTPNSWSMAGWIAPDGGVYVIDFSAGRFLDYYRNGMRQFREPAFLAVPTHDFSGAWILTRGPGAPTILKHHSFATGMKTQWTDVSAPEVEALIPGRSGQTVLVQVHRERPQSERPFIDPALAVWRVGQPAPRFYDELFLNEGFTKTFVHVDPDRIAEGEAFVFDSGLTSPGSDLPVSPPIEGGGGDVTQEWGVVRGSLRQRLVLPGVARLRGAFDSYWLTDVIVYNPLEEPQDVVVQYTPIAGPGEVQQAILQQQRLTLAAREIRLLPDVLHTLFGFETAGGALYFDPAVSINVTGRTYSRRADGGTFGFGMLAIDFFNAAGPRFPLSFSGAFPGQHYRTNVLLTDTSGRGTEAKLQAHGVSGTIGSSDVGFGAVPNGVNQANGIGGALGLLPHESGGLVVRPSRGTAIPTVVAIDNRTNDPTYFPPDLPNAAVRTIPVIGHVDGANNSRFRSDLYLLNLSEHTRTVTLEATPWDASTAPEMVQFTLLPSEARVIADVLPKLFGMEGLARLRYWSQGIANETEGVRATSRTYTLNEDGSTYGCLIPPLNNFQSASSGEALEILGIVGGNAFRTNVGLIDLLPRNNGTKTDVRVTILDHSGKTVDTFVVTVTSATGMQINDIFGARGVTAPSAGLVHIEVLSGPGLIGAYATLTDNITNDSTFLGAQLAAQR